MEISRAKTATLAELNNDSKLVTLASPPLLTPLEVESLEVMMRQARALKPNQDIMPDTAAMYVLEWAEMVKKYGLNTFKESLLTVLRDSQFFPDPAAIREACAARSYHESMRESGRRAVREHDERVAQWKAERQEAGR